MSGGEWAEVFAARSWTWSLRGDPGAWDAMRAYLVGQPVPPDEERISGTLRAALAHVMGEPRFPFLVEPVQVEAFDKGGMSHGQVDPVVWRESLLPMLERRARHLSGAAPSAARRAAEADLALGIARCPELGAVDTDPVHPCRRIVALQGPGTNPDRQVPEAWAGALLTARVLFVSSNPSISELGDSHSRTAVEDYPHSDWPDERIVDFITARCDPDRPEPWMLDDRFRRTDGELSPQRVRYWQQARKRASELLGWDAEPFRDYAMTEVVRCKSKAEAGVAEAAGRCVSRWFDRTLELCPAPVVVIVGAQARDRARTVLDLPDLFGRKGGSPGDHVTVMTLAGVERVVVYLPHFTGMEAGGRTFLARFGQEYLARFRAVATDRLRPSDVQHLAQSLTGEWPGDLEAAAGSSGA